MANERDYWYWFVNLEGIGVRKGNRLLERFHEPSELYRASEKYIREMEGVTERDKQAILKDRNISKFQKKLDNLAKKYIYFIPS